MSLECEASLINLKELTEKENGEVADEKVNCKEKVEFVDWSCDKPFTMDGVHIYNLDQLAWQVKSKLKINI